uniref:(northern house mosquito) hypothetical protein n=1 Tax=Culex pipiens TaxID=7175 RepID=A0A8D8AJ48_CULPI
MHFCSTTNTKIKTEGKSQQNFIPKKNRERKKSLQTKNVKTVGQNKKCHTFAPGISWLSKLAYFGTRLTPAVSNTKTLLLALRVLKSNAFYPSCWSLMFDVSLIVGCMLKLVILGCCSSVLIL